MKVLEKEKYRLIQEIIKDTDKYRISKVSTLYKKKPSFMCSAEELRDSLPKIEREIAGGKYISHEEMVMTKKAL